MDSPDTVYRCHQYTRQPREILLDIVSKYYTL
jgi:hypothetical protein